MLTLHLSLLSFRSLLSMVGKNDSHQLRLVFNSIDKNRDGHLSQGELEEFAKELG